MVVHTLVKLIIITSLIISAVTIGVGGAASAADDGSFNVNITDTNTSVAEGETVAIEAKITNTGSEEDSEQIHLKRNDSIVDSVKDPPVTLAPGESTDVMLEWSPEYGDAGHTELVVWSDDSSDRLVMDVGEGPALPVAIDSTSGPVLGGESLTVSVTVRNTGETTETTPIELSVANELRAEKSVELASGESEQVDLSWETMENDTGTRTVEVVSADAAADSQVRIFDSTEVVSTDTVDSTEVVSTDGATESPGQPGFGIGIVVIALLVIALLGYGRYRN